MSDKPRHSGTRAKRGQEPLPLASAVPPRTAERLGPVDSSRLRLQTPFRRATVLIMVVALLGMLFVAGVAFLQTVTFEARQIDREIQVRDQTAGVDAVESGLFEVLNRGWLSTDGVPYRMNSANVVNWT